MRKIEIPKYIAITEAGEKVMLPDDMATQGFAYLARRRSGKSSAVGTVEEIMLEHGDPWICIDPAGAHWGIKYRAGKDGLPDGPSGYDVLVVGGDHADVDLNPHGGKALAEVLVETNISCVIDVSLMGMTDRKRFMTDFANRLFELNKTPRHLIIDECHEFVPQQPRFPEQVAVLGAISRLITGGGGRGIGFTLISQRPAAVNKDVLTQIDNLVVLRMSGPADLKAVTDWFEHNVGDKQRMKEILGTLAKFEPGEAWIMSPEWLGEIARVRFRQRVTYHAGRTPKKGERPVDVRQFGATEAANRLKSRMLEMAAAKMRDATTTKELKERIKQLEREVQHLKSAQPVPSPADVRAHADKIADKIIDKYVHDLDAKLARMFRQLSDVLHEESSRANAMAELVAALEIQTKKLLGTAPTPTPMPATEAASKQLEQVYQPPAVLKLNGHTPRVQFRENMADREKLTVGANAEMFPNGDIKLSGSAREMLQILCSWHPQGLTKPMLAALKGIKYNTGSFPNRIKELRDPGLIDERDGKVFATRAAFDYLGEDIPPAPRTTAEVMQRWKANLSGTSYRMLEHLVITTSEGREIHKRELADRVGVKYETGSFPNRLAELRTAGLMLEHGNGIVSANRETLFL